MDLNFEDFFEDESVSATKGKKRATSRSQVTGHAVEGPSGRPVSATEYFSTKHHADSANVRKDRALRKVRPLGFVLQAGAVGYSGKRPEIGAITVGRDMFDPTKPPVPVWWQPGDMKECAFRVPRLDAPFEISVLIEGVNNCRWGSPPDEGGPPVFRYDPAKPEDFVPTLRDDGPLFRKPRKPRIWAELDECMVTWTSKGMTLTGTFDPSKIVLPFGSYRTPDGTIRRVLLPERAEYDGKPMNLEYGRWTSSPGITDHDVPSFWTEGPEGLKPYTGPWGKDEE